MTTKCLLLQLVGSGHLLTRNVTEDQKEMSPVRAVQTETSPVTAVQVETSLVRAGQIETSQVTAG